jgi:hypothetical protein
VQFTKAVRKRAKLRLALTGPSGSGKTYGALMIAKGIGGKIAVIDSEHGSASLYCHLCDFDALELTPPYSPERYIAAIKAAEQAGYDVIVIDSTTHEWSGSGGCLEINEQTARAKFSGNTWSAWNDTTPRHRAFIDAMLQSSAHIIATGRSKTETAQTEGPNGKKKVVKLGMKTEQRDGFEYEFTAVLDLIHDGHYATASKDRTGMFGGDPKPVSETTGRQLREWLESGAEPVRMDPSQLADLIASIETAANMGEFKARAAEAHQAATALSDDRALSAIEAACAAKLAKAQRREEAKA